MLNVKITIDDGSGKKAHLEISEADNLSKLVVIQNVFNLFGIKTDVLEMVDDYNKIGKLYSDFFENVQPIEPIKINDHKFDKNDIKEKLIQGLTENKNELETTYKETDDTPEHYKTGIKLDKDGKTKRYQLRYECPACFNRGKHFIYQTSKKTWCHRCQHSLEVFDAHPDGFPLRDNFGNYFRAGDYRDDNLTWKF